MIKFKRKSQHFMNGNMMEMKFVIQALVGGKWMMFGDDDGVFKFDNKEDRDAKIEELKAANLTE